MEKIIHCRNSNCKYYYEDGCFKNTKMIVLNENGKCEDFEKGLFEGYMNCTQCKNWEICYKHIKIQCGLFNKKITHNGELCKEFIKKEKKI